MPPRAAAWRGMGRRVGDRKPRAAAARPAGAQHAGDLWGMPLVRTVSALAARQLVAQGRESLVRGERAGRAALVTAIAGRRRAAAAPGLGGLAVGAAGLAALRLLGGLARLGDLAAVRLETGPRLRVLVLPLLALRVIPFQPLARVRVEAVRVDVVALVVVGGGHAVQGRVEV